jgi:hypothetical protein
MTGDQREPAGSSIRGRAPSATRRSRRRGPRRLVGGIPQACVPGRTGPSLAAPTPGRGRADEFLEGEIVVLGAAAWTVAIEGPG